MADFTLVLCLAGLGSRFTKEGYTTPKFLLPMADGTTSILREILTAFRGMEGARALLVFNKRYTSWEEAIATSLAGLPFPLDIRFIDDTQGQAETASKAMDTLEEVVPEMMGKPVIFHNGDTVLYGRDMADYARKLLAADGLIDSFDMDSAAYSYVTTDKDDRILEMKEKVVISRQATTGLYGFGSPAVYRNYYAKAQGTWQKEFYISDVYRAMLADDAVLRNVHKVNPADTLNLGTPAEYESYLAEARKQGAH